MTYRARCDGRKYRKKRPPNQRKWLWSLSPNDRWQIESFAGLLRSIKLPLADKTDLRAAFMAMVDRVGDLPTSMLAASCGDEGEDDLED